MNGRSFRSRLTLGFVLPLLLAAAVSWLTFSALLESRESSLEATESMTSLKHLTLLLRGVVDAESAERGFAITGNPSFLEPYEGGVRLFEASVRSLREGADPSTSESLERVASLFERWRSEVAEPVIAARARTPIGLALDAQLSHTSFLSALHAEADYVTTRDAEYLQAWRVHMNTFRDHLSRIVAHDLEPDVAASWRVVIEGLASYERYVLSGSAFDSTRGDAVDALLQELATTHRVDESRVTALIVAGAGKALVDEIRLLSGQLEGRKLALLAARSARSDASTRLAILAALGGPVAAVLLSLGVIVLLQRGVARDIRTLVEAAREIAGGRLDRRVPEGAVRELGVLARAFNTMSAHLSEREHQTERLGEMNSLLQTCGDSSEAYAVVERTLPALFPGTGGALFMVNASRNVLEGALAWGSAALPNDAVFAPPDCWALRLGRIHAADGGGMTCRHSEGTPAAATLCVPLVSRDEALGVLYIRADDPKVRLENGFRQLVVGTAENLALALANLRLRETLRNQSIRDPLTGLFNRRYLEEAIELELHRSQRTGRHLSLVVFDIDHFKRFNDTFGHEAGDVVLREVGALVKRSSRAGDVACRYGGEEFVLVLGETDGSGALARAEALRESVKRLALRHADRALGEVTVSLGVASVPQHGRTFEAAFAAADAALYAAKRAGRDRTVVAPGTVAGSVPASAPVASATSVDGGSTLPVP